MLDNTSAAWSAVLFDAALDSKPAAASSRFAPKTLSKALFELAACTALEEKKFEAFAPLIPSALATRSFSAWLLDPALYWRRLVTA
jgi:hypothetical protein